MSGAPVLWLMTINTLFKPPTELRWRELAAWAAAEDPDVLCLQECRREDGRDVAGWLASSLPGTWFVAFGGVETSEGCLSGNVVLSRWPIEHQQQSRLECDDNWPKVLLHARTAGLDVYCVHLYSALDGAAVREAQVLFVSDFVQATADPGAVLPPILAGDWERSAHRRYCLWRGRWERFPNRGFPGGEPRPWPVRGYQGSDLGIHGRIADGGGSGKGLGALSALFGTKRPASPAQRPGGPAGRHDDWRQLRAQYLA